MGNTSTTAALVCVFTGAPPPVAVGRGTGVGTRGRDRKRAVAAQSSQAAQVPHLTRARHGSAVDGPALAGLAGLAGATGDAVGLGLPVVLDGYVVGAGALAAVRVDPTVPRD